MINAPRLWLSLIALAMCAASGSHSARQAAAQPSGQAMPALGMYALPAHAASATPPQPPANRAPAPAAPRGPLARLVHNPQPLEGLPPFALADQTGRIQRYVEPVPGIDLEAYVGQTVVVRHDTGRTLLATQLELPPQRLRPLVEEATGIAHVSTEPNGLGAGGTSLRQAGLVKPAQYVDDDDTTVELLADGEEPDGETSALVTNPTESFECGAIVELENESFDLVPGMPMEEHAVEELAVDPMFAGPMHGYPHAIESYPHDDYGMETCAECGGYHVSDECGPYIGSDHRGMIAPSATSRKLFADLELNFLRTHLPQTAAGKLSEKYEFTPRVIVGFRETGKVDGRIRFWTYDRDTAVLGGTPIRADFDVFDIEGTHSLAGRRSEVTIGAGLRLASIDLTDNEGETSGSDLIGMTISADGRAPFTVVYGCEVAAVYGARLSILGGDWGGAPGNDFTGGLVQDDTVIVHELFGGVDVATRYRGVDIHGRLGFEMQNWHSDALSQNGGADSIGFLGPGLQLGAEF